MLDLVKLAKWNWKPRKNKMNLGQNTRAKRQKPIFQTIDSDLKRVLKHPQGLYEGPIHHGQGNL